MPENASLRSPKLLTLVREAIRVRGYSPRTGKAYVAWNVLGDPMAWEPGIVWARRTQRLPTILSRAEVDKIIQALDGTEQLAVRRAGITKRVTCHVFRHAFATHLLADG